MNHGAQDVRTQTDQLAAAWQWVLRLREEEASQEDVTAWLHWYELDPRHQAAFEEMQTFWRESGRLDTDPRAVAELLSDADDAGGEVENPTMVPSRTRRRVLAWSGAALAAAASLTLVIGLQLHPTSPPTAVAQEKQLPDGSKVQLAARSSVEVQYTPRQRLLQMSAGVAYFSVSKDPARPFVVNVGDLQVRAVGTAFNIRRADARTVVTVTEGAVDVLKNGDSVRAAAGERLTFDGHSGAPEKATVDAAHALAWRNGRLEYLNEPLAAVIADINRYARHPVTFADEAAGRILFSGTVFTAETDAWIRALPRVFAVEVRVEDDGRRVLVRTD